jgi:hypothetical protein
VQGQTGIAGTSGGTGLQGQTGLQGNTGVFTGGVISFSIAPPIGAVSTGIMGTYQLSGNTNFSAWTVFTDVTSSVKVDVLKSTYSTYPTFVSYIGSTGIYTSSTIKNNGTVGWWGGTTGTSGDLVQAKILSTDSSASKVTLALTYNVY